MISLRILDDDIRLLYGKIGDRNLYVSTKNPGYIEVCFLLVDSFDDFANSEDIIKHHFDGTVSDYTVYYIFNDTAEYKQSDTNTSFNTMMDTAIANPGKIYSVPLTGPPDAPTFTIHADITNNVYDTDVSKKGVSGLQISMPASPGGGSGPGPGPGQVDVGERSYPHWIIKSPTNTPAHTESEFENWAISRLLRDDPGRLVYLDPALGSSVPLYVASAGATPQPIVLTKSIHNDLTRARQIWINYGGDASTLNPTGDTHLVTKCEYENLEFEYAPSLGYWFWYYRLTSSLFIFKKIGSWPVIDGLVNVNNTSASFTTLSGSFVVNNIQELPSVVRNAGVLSPPVGDIADVVSGNASVVKFGTGFV